MIIALALATGRVAGGPHKKAMSTPPPPHPTPSNRKRTDEGSTQQARPQQPMGVSCCPVCSCVLRATYIYTYQNISGGGPSVLNMRWACRPEKLDSPRQQRAYPCFIQALKGIEGGHLNFPLMGCTHILLQIRQRRLSNFKKSRKKYQYTKCIW